MSQPEGNRESAVDRDSQNFTENKRKMEQIAPIIQKPMNPAVSLNFIFKAEQVLWSFGKTAGFEVFYKENEIEPENPDDIERIHELENTSEEIRDCLEAGREGHKKLYVVTIDRIPNQAIGILNFIFISFKVLFVIRFLVFWFLNFGLRFCGCCPWR